MNKRLWLSITFALACLQLFAQVVPNTYILELDTAPALEGFQAGRHRVAKQEFENRRTLVRNGQRRTIQALQSQGGRVRHQLDTILNGLVVEISDAKAARLSTLPGVKRVQPVYQVKAHLDRALPLHKVPEAWNNLPDGPDSAGAGIKVGIIDTGVDVKHPGFVDSSRSVPDGYPKFTSTNEELDRANLGTNTKVIVMRSYEPLLDRSATRVSAMDGQGHGTGTAFAAVGKRVDGPFGPVSGAAPSAFLGVYKITVADTPSTNTSAILAALDDAVKDGMDVINLSFGNSFGFDDAFDVSMQRVADAGVIFTSSIGNQGPGFQSNAWPANSPFVIGVGSSGNGRQVSSRGLVSVDGSNLTALVGSNSTGKGRFTGTVKDSAAFGAANELGCDPFPVESMTGSIALILRGTCTFEIKLNNAKAAGAIAGIVYNPTQLETGVIMQQGLNFTPAVWINNTEGLALKAKLSANPDSNVVIDTIPAVTPNRLSIFSGMGPSTTALHIKPDVVAVGDFFVTASPVSCCAQWGEQAGYALTTGFVAIQGTSFSSPFVAGAAATLKQSRPGLTQQQYRSLITNTASPLLIAAESDRQAIPFEAGAGRMDLLAAQKATAAVWPVSISFGGGLKDVLGKVRSLKITNLGDGTDTFSITVEPIGDSTRPVLGAESVTLEPKAEGTVEVTFSGSDLRGGSHHGVLLVKGTTNDVPLRVPYWYGVASDEPGSIAVITDPDSPVAGAARVSFVFRVTDTSGQALDNAKPEVEFVTEGGRVDAVDPDTRGNGLFRAQVRPGRTVGFYEFRIKAGAVTYSVFVEVI